MATNYGRTATAGNDTWASNVGTNNQYGCIVTGVPAGVIAALDVFMAGSSGGTCRTILCLWDYPSGNLLAQTAQFTAAAGGGGVNGQAWQRAVLTSPIVVGGGSYFVGFWRNGADAAEFSYNSGSGTIHPQAPGGGVTNVGSPGALNLGSTTTGQMSAYLEWQASGVYVYNGSAWVQSPVYVYDGSSWQLSNGVYVYNGSAWVLVN